MRFSKWFIALAAVAVATVATPRSAVAGTVILEGSDAIGFHCPLGSSGACTYRDQAWSAIGGSDPRPIAVIGTGEGTITSGTHPVVDAATLSLLPGSLSDYVALYFVASTGCCEENDSLVIGHETDISNYLAAGGTVMIENYIGGAAWDFAVGTGGAGNSHVVGVGGGEFDKPDAGCSDGETVTADGLANGFTQPPVMGCWTHQAYDESYFGALGFTKSFFDSPSDLGGAGFSSLLSNGSTVTGSTVPEPASLLLLGTGLVGAVRRRRNRK